MTNIILSFIAMIVIGVLAFWYSHPKPKIAICWKCKYCVKTMVGWQITKISCRNPEDPSELNYLTGKVYKPTYSCDIRNRLGTCPNFKKVWWRR